MSVNWIALPALPAVWCRRLCLIVSLAGCLSAWAASSASATESTVDNIAGELDESGYSLSQAFVDALARDPRIRAAQARIGQAQANLREAKSGRRPSITVSGGYGHIDNRNDAQTIRKYDGRSRQHDLRISQPVYSFGRVKSRVGRAQSDVCGTEHVAKEVRQQIFADAARHYVEQFLHKNILTSHRKFEQLLQQLLDTANKRLALGYLNKIELYEVRRRLYRATAERKAAESRYRIARAGLQALTGVNREKLSVASLETLESNLPKSLKNALARANLASPGLAQAKQRLDGARWDLAFSKAERRPNLMLEMTAGEGRVGDIDNSDRSAHVRMTLPLYDGGRKTARISSAHQSVQAAEAEVRAAERQLEVDVRANWDLVSSIYAAQQNYTDAVATAQEMSTFVKTRLEQGHGTLVDLIEARQTALETRFDAAQNWLNLELARIHLLASLALLGTSPEESTACGT